MQDILGQANLPAGAVYRYFRSKDEIIVAIAGAGRGPRRGLPRRRAGRRRAGFRQAGRPDLGRGGAVPALAEIIKGEIGRVRDALARLVRAYQDRGLMAADVPSEQVAQVLIGLLPGFVFQHALLGDVDPAAFRAGLRTLLTTRLDSPLPSPAST
jgi:AcrR family transcriptional regulator